MNKTDIIQKITSKKDIIKKLLYISASFVIIAGISGFIFASKFMNQKHLSSAEGTEETVISLQANVRKKASKDSEPIGQLRHNEHVFVISTEKEWSKIQYKNEQGALIKGYVISNFLLKSSVNPYKKLNITFDQQLEKQVQRSLEGGNKIYANGGFQQVDAATISPYVNPEDININRTGIYEFARIDKYTDGVKADDINKVLNKLGSKNVFYNKGQVFIDAAKENNIDVVYLVAHALWESQSGESKLAKGQSATDKNGKGVTVYNFFGIGATDGNADSAGSATSNNAGWTSVDQTIKGSAKWIAENYLHNSKYNQKTLYTMRWHYDTVWHQYATDINWAAGIAQNMGSLISLYKERPYTFEIPVYKK